jgi:hypothetical protein
MHKNRHRNFVCIWRTHSVLQIFTYLKVSASPSDAYLFFSDHFVPSFSTTCCPFLMLTQLLAQKHCCTKLPCWFALQLQCSAVLYTLFYFLFYVCHEETLSHSLTLVKHSWRLTTELWNVLTRGSFFYTEASKASIQIQHERSPALGLFLMWCELQHFVTSITNIKNR